MAKVVINRRGSDGEWSSEASEVPAARFRGVLLHQADKSDPLNQLVVAGISIKDRLAIRVTVEREDGRDAVDDAVAALALALVDHHAEIRDAMMGAGDDH